MSILELLFKSVGKDKQILYIEVKSVMLLFIFKTTTVELFFNSYSLFSPSLCHETDISKHLHFVLTI